MVNSQEIVERSVYDALLRVAIALGYSLDPNLYLPESVANAAKMKSDILALTKYIPIFGTANASAKDQKTTPRIVVNARGFYPGGIGMPKELIEKSVGQGFTINEEPYEVLDQYIDVHLVANTQEDLRLLHQILFWALPQRGYIKPYNEENFLFSGNIFIEVGNFYDYPNNTLGLLEKVYQYKVFDTILGEQPDAGTLPAIHNIQVLLEKYDLEGLLDDKRTLIDVGELPPPPPEPEPEPEPDDNETE